MNEYEKFLQKLNERFPPEEKEYASRFCTEHYIDEVLFYELLHQSLYYEKFDDFGRETGIDLMTFMFFPGKFEHKKKFDKEHALALVSEARSQMNVTPEYNQNLCSSQSAVARAEIIAAKSQGKRVLLLGDDDCVGLALSVTGAEIHVVDIDEKMLSLFETVARNHSLDICTHCVDLRKTVLEDFYNYFDVFETDPPWTFSGLALFLLHGLAYLKPREGCRGYVSASPFLMPRGDVFRFQKFLLSCGFMIEEIKKSFNSYPGIMIKSGMQIGSPSFYSDFLLLRLMDLTFKKDVALEEEISNYQNILDYFPYDVTPQSGNV